MRELKFRAWHIPSEKFEIVNCYQDFGICGEVGKGFFHFEEEDYILMQYTGLKDKNGKDIYEGDILKHPDYCNGSLRGENISQVEWGQTGDSDGYYYEGHVTWVTKENHNSLLDIHKSSEVIGNIYENPELLEVNHE